MILRFLFLPFASSSRFSFGRGVTHLPAICQCAVALIILAGCAAVDPLQEAAPDAASDAPGAAGQREGTTGLTAAPNQNVLAFKVRPMNAADSEVDEATGALHTDLTTISQSVAARQAQIDAYYRSNGASVEEYHGTMAAIEARLHLGTIARNPVLINQWNEAQTALDQIAWNLTGLNGLVDELDEHVQAMRAIRQQARQLQERSEGRGDDRAQLDSFRDDLTTGLNVTQGIMANILEEMGRHGTLLILQRDEMAVLKRAVETGDLAAVDSKGEMARAASLGRQQGVDMVRAGMSPLVIIRFDRPNVSYEVALADVVSRALEIDPGARFKLLSVAPQTDNEIIRQQSNAAAQQYAQAVRRSLAKLGVAPDQIVVGFANRAETLHSEVHIYID